MTALPPFYSQHFDQVVHGHNHFAPLLRLNRFQTKIVLGFICTIDTCFCQKHENTLVDKTSTQSRVSERPNCLALGLHRSIAERIVCIARFPQ